jgi:hypothetical protein
MWADSHGARLAKLSKEIGSCLRQLRPDTAEDATLKPPMWAAEKLGCRQRAARAGLCFLSDEQAA